MIGDPKPTRKKKNRIKKGQDTAYTEWIKTQPCSNPNCLGNCGDIVPAHQPCLGTSGVGMKAIDRHTLPLGVLCHDKEHSGHVTFWGQGAKPKTKIYIQNLCYEHMEKYNLCQI